MNKYVESVRSFQADGIWVISNCFPEKNKHRKGRSVVFVEKMKVGKPCWWIYSTAYNQAPHDSFGKIVSTSAIEDIKIAYNGDIQLSTKNSQYMFRRML